MCALPAATHLKADTLVGRQTIINVAFAAGDPVNLLVSIVDIDAILEILRNKAPGADNGPTYTQRAWESDRSEMIKAETDEIAKVISILGSLSGRKDATVTVYIRDPKDAANTVAYKSDAFACSVYRDPASIRVSSAAASRTTLIFESHKDGPIAWSKDASTA